MRIFRSPSVMVKFSLLRPSGTTEVRRVQLRNGTSTPLSELLATLEALFCLELEPRLTYVDGEGDSLTISTDAELQDALANDTGIMSVVAAHRQEPDLSGWELVADDRAVTSASTKVGASHSTVPWSRQLRFWLNGELQVIENPSPAILLVHWLREVKGLTGTKVACGEGGCGACTVALAVVRPGGSLETLSVNACLRRLCALDGCHVLTTEGIGNQRTGFHPVQKAIADGNGSQCGYCTPGWVMQMFSLLQKGEPTHEQVEQHFDGNLCRCTGYRPILSAFGKFAKGGACTSAVHDACAAPPAGLLDHASAPLPLHFCDTSTGQEWYRPLNLEQLALARAAAKAASKEVHIICAGTAAGVEKYYRTMSSTDFGIVFADISAIPELQASSFDGSSGLHFGAAVTLANVIVALEAHSPSALGFDVLAEHVKRIASVQIRNVASWAGNLMLVRRYPNFASDLALVLATVGAEVAVVGEDGAHKVVGIPELLRLPGDPLVVSLRVPVLPKLSILRTYKTAQRHVFAHAIANMAICIRFGEDSVTVSSASIFVGGACNSLLEAKETAAAFAGKRLDQATLSAAASVLEAEIERDASTNARYSTAYRRQLCVSFLYKAVLAAHGSLPPELQSTQACFIPADARPLSCGTESYGEVPADAPVGSYVPKLDSRVQASGEAIYTSDSGRGALFGQPVFATTAKAKLAGMDSTKAKQMPGFVDFVTASDVKGENVLSVPCGKGNACEKVFFGVGDTIPCIGAMLGLVVADTWEHARQAAKQVAQAYTQLDRVVAFAEDAQRLGREAGVEDLADAAAHVALPWVSSRRALKLTTSPWGVDFEADTSTRSDASQKISGVFKTGGQSHLYMETQSVVATPLDGDHWEFLVSDQFPDLTSTSLAAILGVPTSHINCKTRRAGGGFGGKLTRQLLLASACGVAAQRLRTTVRGQLERSDDMQMIVGREPMNFDYNVTVGADGRVDTMDMVMEIFPGWFFGDAAGDLAMATQWSDNCYMFNRFKVDTKISMTDTPHSTSQRAPGCMQSLIASEMIMEHVAKSVGRPLDEVQEMNFYKIGDKTPFGDVIGHDGYNWTIPTLWSKLQKDACFKERKSAVDAYNAQNRWTKKGIAISPVKYIFDVHGGYRSGALVCVYADGTVLVSHGGTEIGQGINTKVTLCVAQTLGIPVEKVSIGTTETAKVPNNTATGGSGTSESSCQAAIMACAKIIDTLKPYRQDKKLSWEDAVAGAIKDGKGLLATGWWVAPATSNTTQYATYGVGISETLLDALTGEVRVERVDILMDLGTQLDAAVDLGQVQGGFIMSLGYCFSEQCKVDASGAQLFLGTWEYKVPTAYDIPIQFNVSLLKDTPNPSPAAIRGSKAVAEPAMGLVASTVLAVKQCLYEVREQNGLGDDWFPIQLPLTPEVVLSLAGTKKGNLTVPPL